MLDRSQILLDALKVQSDEVRWYFIADYYDGPISGLAHFRGSIYRFCCFPEDVPNHIIYVLQKLEPSELAEELNDKEKFEELVGTHWSFDHDGKPLPRVVRSAESQKSYFYHQVLKKNPSPWDRPIVAWF